MVGFILSFICLGFLFFLVLGALVLCAIIFPIIAGLKANEGADYNYPYSLNLIK